MKRATRHHARVTAPRGRSAPATTGLAEVDPGVTDELRLAHNIDALADTKASEKRFDQKK